jgi:AraC-like DNA-binding protein
MPSSAVHTFTDPDDYAAKIRNTRAEVVVTGRGQFTAEITRIDLHRLWMQRFSDNLPRVGHSTGTSGRERTVISFRTEPGARLLWGAAEMLPTNIIRHGDGESTFQRSYGSASWGGMSLPLADALALSETFAGCDLTPPRHTMLITPPAPAIAKLQRLHAAAGGLARDTPELIAHPEAAHGLEQALIEAMVDCLVGPEVRAHTLAQAQHAVVIRRFRRVVEQNPEHPLYIPEICKAIRVSSRTLQACCHEHLGMGPKHYLLLRRMHLARRALRQGGPETASVTEIATRYGFWQLGRFAVEYQSLFRESPSATLARQFE